ncbi:MAG: glycosyltransferase family 1 protein [Anaerolineae bacterium]|nr:glycosyltransferase family 1 protein [Anaerolineae bacterium]
MQITLIAAGSRGDVQPYVALGKGLHHAGHRVHVLTSTDFQQLVADQGLVFFDMGGSAEAALQARPDLLDNGNLLKNMAFLRQALQKLAYLTAEGGLKACRESDLVIGGFAGLPVGVALAEKFGVPFIEAHILPFTPTRAFPSALLPLPPALTLKPLNRLTHQFARQMMWQTFRPIDRDIRRNVLQIGPTPFWGPFGALDRQPHPVLYGYSPQILPFPEDWPARIHVTGFWFLDPASDWTPPSDLVDFLQSGPPPVYVGFGSMKGGNPGETTRLVVQALERAGQRGVLSSGWGGLARQDLPSSIYMLGAIPHSWLFPQMAAVVHHGGVGTTSAGLRAGVPSVIIPFFGDQPFWGRRIYESGVGPAPIPRQRLTMENLSQAIQSAVTDRQMQDNAARIGQAIRAEDGVAEAVKIIEQIR